jgi:farnesyl diphosphate synthase
MLAASLAEDLAANAAAVESVLVDLLDGAHWPPRLTEAMRHGTLAGGKRLRPFLVVETARMLGREGPGVLRVGAAVELIHAYSLIHDDLPAMDNDDLRRGRPTVHRAFDTATAILAGDALLTLAFEVLADPEVDEDPDRRSDLVAVLAKAAGPAGMVGGPMLDLAAEGRFAADQRPLRLDAAEIARLQAMKTGCLITAAVEMGAVLGAADRGQRAGLRHYGEAVGAAFQIADDLLDVEGTTESLGKAAGKDAAAGKATLVSLWGLEQAHRRLDELVIAADRALAPFGAAADGLRRIARFVAERRS